MVDDLLPNLFVVGAAKSGTTALYHYFTVHPEIYVPKSIKETNYMAFYQGLPRLLGPGDHLDATGQSVTSLPDYLNLYKGRQKESIRADVSPYYLYYPQASQKIAELCPGARIVIILRNPVECAFSMFGMLRRARREPLTSFRKAFAQSEKRIEAGWEGGWDYKGFSMFSKQVARYMDRFPSSQLFIRRYEDFNNTPESFYSDLCKFMDVSYLYGNNANSRVNVRTRYIDDLQMTKRGRTMVGLARVVSKVFPRTIKTKLRKAIFEKPAYTLSDKDRAMLVDHFAHDIRNLEKILGWDLKEWVTV